MTSPESETRNPLPVSSRGPRWGRWLVSALLAGFLIVLGISLYRSQAGQRGQGPAPDFTLQRFDGGTLALSEQRGKVVMIDFWAAWCGPCREEAGKLESLWQEYQGREVVFVGVAYADIEAESRAFLEEFGITYPNGPDLGTRISQAYRIRGVPEKFFIDRCGQIRHVIIGPAPAAELRQALEDLLAEPTTC